MKILLTAVNAKFIHSCPAVYSLRAYSSEMQQHIDIAEYTINDRYNDVLADIISKKPDVIAFATYIWNVDFIRELISDIKQIAGKTIQIWVGGPEATNAPEKFMPGADLCIIGEGEYTFKKLAQIYESGSFENSICNLQGIAWMKNNEIIINAPAQPIEMDEIPFLYDNLSLFDNRIIYYESSRGCPFNCIYCLSSIERKVRFRNIDIVKKELKFFLDNNVKQVKFVDRTFNCSHTHAMEIWKFINDNDNGITNFHFEIGADIITDEEIEFLNTLRPGLIQMEIGVQSVNMQTINEVRRVMDIDRLKEVVRGIRKAANINLHLDLIAGLPYENLDSFKNSFNEVYDMRSNQFQLGFLKVLSGTDMSKRCAEYEIAFSNKSPYEVLCTKWISFEEICLLKRICDMVEDFYNSQFFIRSLPVIEKHFDTPYDMYESLAEYYKLMEYDKKQPAARKRYDILLDFMKRIINDKAEIDNIIEYLRFDKALHFNPSRHMDAQEKFKLDGKDVKIFIDYSKKNPINGEAAYKIED